MTTPARRQVADRIAQLAVSWIGHCYLWGGAAGADGLSCTDCSGAVNWWVGAGAGQAIPGFAAGTYDGSQHGPSTLGWLGWIGEGVFGITRAEVTAGDIMCWQTHMGVAISNTEMVSDLNPSIGTRQTQIDGLIPGEQLFTLRLRAVDPSETGIGVIGLTGESAVQDDARAIARTIKTMIPLARTARSVGAHGWRL